MKSVCDGNKDDGGNIHCVCYKCTLDCENNKNVEEHQHKWRCERIGRNVLVEMIQKDAEEMMMLEKVVSREVKVK